MPAAVLRSRLFFMIRLLSLQHPRQKLDAGLQTILVEVELGIVDGACGIAAQADIGANTAVILNAVDKGCCVVGSANVSLKVDLLEPRNLGGFFLNCCHKALR